MHFVRSFKIMRDVVPCISNKNKMSEFYRWILGEKSHRKYLLKLYNLKDIFWQKSRGRGFDWELQATLINDCLEKMLKRLSWKFIEQSIVKYIIRNKEEPQKEWVPNMWSHLLPDFVTNYSRKNSIQDNYLMLSKSFWVSFSNFHMALTDSTKQLMNEIDDYEYHFKHYISFSVRCSKTISS